MKESFVFKGDVGAAQYQFQNFSEDADRRGGSPALLSGIQSQVGQIPEVKFSGGIKTRFPRDVGVQANNVHGNYRC